MRIFVTGGSGFLGQHLLRRLIDQGHTVSALARSDRAVAAVQAAGAVAVCGDLADLTRPDTPASWTAALNGHDAVVHAAARVEFWGPDAGFRRDNHEPSVALHQAAADAGVGRFVLVSAASVSTGSQRAAVVDEHTGNGKPNIAYSRVKLATEQALLAAQTPGMATVVLRPPLVWGAGMTTLTETIELARAGGFSWIDNGRHIMDFVHVDNLAHAVELALTRGRDGGIYYITDATPMPIRDYLTQLLGTAGVDVSNARSVPLGLAAPLAAVLDGSARLLRRRTPPPLTNWLVTITGCDRSYDITSARRELGYTPLVTLQQGLAEMASAAGADSPRPPAVADPVHR